MVIDALGDKVVLGFQLVILAAGLGSIATASQAYRTAQRDYPPEPSAAAASSAAHATTNAAGDAPGSSNRGSRESSRGGSRSPAYQAQAATNDGDEPNHSITI